MEAAHAFHLRLTQLCGNTTMMLLAGTLEAVWSFQETRVLLGTEDDPGDVPMRQRAIASHRCLIAAISTGQSDEAGREMSRHIAEMQERVVGTYGSTVIDLATTPPAGPPWPGVRSATPIRSL